MSDPLSLIFTDASRTMAVSLYALMKLYIANAIEAENSQSQRFRPNSGSTARSSFGALAHCVLLHLGIVVLSVSSVCM